MNLKIKNLFFRVVSFIKEIDYQKSWIKIKQIHGKKDVYIFFIFILISTAFWFLNALRDNYISDFSYPVRFINVPQNEIIIGGDEQKVDLKIKASGFTILRQRINRSIVPLVYDFSQMQRLNRGGQSLAYVLTSSQISSVSEQLLMGMEIVNVSPDTIFLTMDKLNNKKVPISLKGDIAFEKQFILADSIHFNPDSVIIKGPKSVLDTVSVVYTEFISTNKLKENYSKKVLLEKINSVSISPKSVDLSILVEPFTEKSFSVPIDVVGLPDSLRMKTFPSSVKVTFRAGMSKFDRVMPDDFRAVVDASEILNGQNSNRLRVRFYKTPDIIQSYDFSPIFVEYFLERQ